MICSLSLPISVASSWFCHIITLSTCKVTCMRCVYLLAMSRSSCLLHFCSLCWHLRSHCMTSWYTSLDLVVPLLAEVEVGLSHLHMKLTRTKAAKILSEIEFKLLNGAFENCAQSVDFRLTALLSLEFLGLSCALSVCNRFMFFVNLTAGLRCCSWCGWSCLLITLVHYAYWSMNYRLSFLFPCHHCDSSCLLAHNPASLANILGSVCTVHLSSSFIPVKLKVL